MLFEKRAERILELLNLKKSVTMHEFVSSLNVSESTIRRDLIALEEQGELRRIHGGATRVNGLRTEQNMLQKESLNQEAKIIIAQYAATLVKPNSQIYIDAGTATLELVRFLPIDINLQVVTNGVEHALTSIQRGLNVTIVGGQVKPNTHGIAGMVAYQQLEKMNFAYAFIGMNGIHEQHGLTTTNIEEAVLKELAMEQSQNIRILMDDSKVDQIYEFKVGVPSQAIILLDDKAKENKETNIDKIIERYDIQFISN